jgi:CxxC motif-containing protein (DUF1111 family)
MKTNIQGFWFVMLALAGLVACMMTLWGATGGIKGRPNHPPPPAPSPTPTLNGFGSLLAGVTAQNKIDWNTGRAQFQVPETIATGLGPIFNGQSCFQCHTAPDANGKPVIGGGSSTTETRFMTSAGIFDLLHQNAITPGVQDGIPADAVVIAHRLSVPLFGVGFMEAVPDATIMANASILQQDGVHGHAAVLSDPVTTRIAGGEFFNGVVNKVGRFGWKCQQASLLAFSGDAMINELGITNRLFGTDFAPHLRGTEPPDQAALAAAEPPGITPTTLQDLPADPSLPESVTNKDDMDRFHDFMKFNAVPPALPLSASALRGQQIFARINCVACHKPTMQTGSVPDEPQLSFKNINLYSDLLLHNMGELGDGIAQQAAGPNDIRTSPLWGLRGRSGSFLHDGRASTIQQAINAHDAMGAESQKIAQRFKQLPPAQQQDLIDFLLSI